MNAWSKVIVHVDMDAFFASVEQRDDPALMGHPVVVTNGTTGNTIITASYEARMYGIKTGMPLWEARKRCDTVVRCPSRPDVYAHASDKIMRALVNEITPTIEVFSVDEAFLDATDALHRCGGPQQLGCAIKKCVYEASGLSASVGISSNKTNAKYAVKLQKPNGLVWIMPGEEELSLSGIPTTDLCGIAKGIGRFLAKHGALFCDQVKTIPLSTLEKRFGYLGKRIWLMCQGKDPDPIRHHVNHPKSMGHSKVLPPNTTDNKTIRLYVNHIAQKLSDRLRSNHLWTQNIEVGAVFEDRGRLVLSVPLPSSSSASDDFSRPLWFFIQAIRHPNEAIRQVFVTAQNPSSVRQNDLFNQQPHHNIDSLVYKLNEQAGYPAIKRGCLLNDQWLSPSVIAPSWRAHGPKQSIPMRET